MRTLNDIVPPSRRKDPSLTSTTNAMGMNAGAGMDMNLPPERPREPLNFGQKRPSRFPYTTLSIVGVIIVLSIAALFYFSSAKIDITPTTVSAAVQGSYNATKSSGALPYEVITAQKVASQSVKGSGTKAVSSSASGMITIYNAQPKVQELITNTRFATASGLIFRIHTAVTIPAGTGEKPGSVTAKVYAEKPGSTYNVPAGGWTVAAFAGTPQATLVYARSTAAMAGGASGNVPAVDATLEAEARTTLTTALTPDLLKSIEEKVPEGYVLLPGSATTSFESLISDPSATSGMVEIKQQGTVTAVVFPNAALAKSIAASLAGLSYQGEPVTLSASDMLSLAPTTDLEAAGAGETFAFTLSGTATLVYTVDPSRIAAAVAGKTRAGAEVAVSSYPEVKRAVIILRPFWRQSFPKDPSSITVDVGAPGQD